MHIAVQIANSVEMYAEKPLSELKILVTGGGAFNQTLIDYITSETDAELVIPEDQIVNFKEAMVFALLGAMRVHGEPNVLHESTGAKVAVVAGSLDGYIDAKQF
jgi:anhydro-N-acetylmuramic acid kinase